jgi:tryptophan halogenase
MKNIVIIGGGTAGWLTALMVNKFWNDSNVTVIESSKIGILGAGEGGTSNFGKILSILEINQKDFFEKTGSSLKNALQLINWNGDGRVVLHPFTGEQSSQLSLIKTYAYHFDAKLVSKYFKEIALKRGVNWIDGEITKINNTNETINTLELLDGKIINLDFVFDCSGFARLITGGIHNEEWIDYSEYLLANKAFGFFLPQANIITDKTITQTKVEAMNAGWMFEIPLQHRLGCGYVFNDKYISVEDAKLEIQERLGTEIQIQKIFDFKPGTYKRSWIGNSISIGLSYSFIEPLEATALMTTIMQLKRLSDVGFDESYRDRFNIWCNEINEQNMLFIRYHYLSEKDDTKFWRDVQSMPIPTKLKSILNENGSIIPQNNLELLKTLNLSETSVNELTFLVSNYNTIFRKNKKIKQKELI